jgi:hypothetical protein
MNDKIQNLLDKFDREEDELLGMMVFDLKTGEILGSTFEDKKAKDIIEIERKTQELEKNKFAVIDPAGKKTWAIYSLERKISVVSRVDNDIFVISEYAIQKSPTGAIEDILEIALLVNNLI